MTHSKGFPPIRWARDYVLRGADDFCSFWEDLVLSRERNILILVGQGFDPRMCSATREILRHGGNGRRDCLLVAFDEGPGSPFRQYADMVRANHEQLLRLVTGRGEVKQREVKMWSPDGRRIGSRNAAGIVHDADDLRDYTDVVVDISALPQSIYFPLIGRLLHILDAAAGTSGPNLHVVASESLELDHAIRPAGLDDDATYVHGFTGGVDMDATADIPRLWIPILGENRQVEIERIYDMVRPAEICPVLPFPSRNPRRGDDLILEYREILFDRLRIDPYNIIYASENNPFEGYTQIAVAVNYYHRVLLPLGGCKVVISALSTKILSMSALLAAYEFRRFDKGIGIAHVEAGGYTIDRTVASPKEELFELWLLGEPYAA